MGAVKAHTTRRVVARPALAPRITRVAAPTQMRLIQPALHVGAVNDPAEHEAEAMAAHVVANASTTPADTPRARPASPAAAPLRRDGADQPDTDSLTEPPVPADHADIPLPPANDVPTETLTSAEVSEMETGQPSVDAAEAQPLRPTSAVVGSAGGPAPADVASRVANPGPGRPLPQALRLHIEPHFATSFADVRLHDTGPDRDASARIGARAFTHGSHIWLGPGEDPTNVALMAHELTHVVQQTEGSQALPLNRAPIRREPGYFARKGERIARHVPGYTLLTVLLGQTLITDEPVAMTAINLLGGLFGLVPGGTAIFDRLNEAHAVEDAFTWVQTRLSALNITWDRISGLLDGVWDAVVSWHPIDNLIDLFKPLVTDIMTFVREITVKVLEFIVRGALKLAGTRGDEVWAVIESARDTIALIVEDPLGFAKNLIRAIVGGFTQFGTNIIEHLKKGVLGWLFGSLGADLQMPEKLDFKGLMSLVLQILGLTYANFRKILVKQLGPRGEKMVAFVEKSIEFVKILFKEGFLGVWQKILSMIDGFKKTLIDGMIEMVTNTVVNVGISWLAKLSNPIGAVIAVVLSIYKFIVTFIERATQIAEVAQSVFSSIGAIARGQVQDAANFIEQTIGRTVPLILAFLAALLDLDGIPAKIKTVFEKLRAPVDKAMTKLVDFLIKKAKALFSKLIAKVNGKRKLPGEPFKIGETEHSIFSEKKGKGLEFMIASKKTPAKEVEDATAAETAKIKEGKSQQDAKDLVAKFIKADNALAKFKNIDTDNAKTPNAKASEAMGKALTSDAAVLNAEGAAIDKNLATSSKVEKGVALFRAREPRVEGFEGLMGPSYGSLQKARDSFVTKTGDKLDKGLLSKYYELDHTIEKRFPIGLAPQLNKLKPKPAAAAGKPAIKRDGAPDPAPGAAGPAGAEVEILGKLGSGDYAHPDGDAAHFPAIALYEGNHLSKKGKGLPEPADIVAAAIREGGADPAGKAKQLLKRQMEVEAAEILQVVNADKDATDVIKADVASGVAQIKALNNAIYGMDKTTAAADTRTEKPDLNGGKGSNMPFDGEPDFDKVEAKGVLYGARTAGLGNYFEYDHIVDNAYPEVAQRLHIITGDQAGAVEAGVKTKGKLTEAQQERLMSLRRSWLFTGTKMSKYDADEGYSLPLYRVIHRWIPTANGATENVTAGHESGVSKARKSLTAYVRDGADSDWDAALTTIRTPIATAFGTRIADHANIVRGLYTANEAEVFRINAAAPPAAVNAKLEPIRKNLAASLGDAPGHAANLFKP